MSDAAKRKLFDWLFQQGVSTVLLVLLVIGIGCVVHDLRAVIPQAISQVQRGYEKIEAAQSAQLERVADEFREDQQRDLELIQRLLSPCPIPEPTHAVNGSSAGP